MENEKNLLKDELSEELNESELIQVTGGSSFKTCKECGKPLISSYMHLKKYGHQFVE